MFLEDQCFLCTLSFSCEHFPGRIVRLPWPAYDSNAVMCNTRLLPGVTEGFINSCCPWSQPMEETAVTNVMAMSIMLLQMLGNGGGDLALLSLDNGERRDRSRGRWIMERIHRNHDRKLTAFGAARQECDKEFCWLRIFCFCIIYVSFLFFVSPGPLCPNWKWSRLLFICWLLWQSGGLGKRLVTKVEFPGCLLLWLFINQGEIISAFHKLYNSFTGMFLCMLHLEESSYSLFGKGSSPASLRM